MKKLSSLTMPWPTKWAQLFGEERPLIVEIGFGNGQYLKHLTDTNPDANLIGIEISNQSLVKAERWIEQEQRQNVRVIHSFAETVLHHMMEPETVSTFHINYPDPWFKKKHSGRRLMQRDTLDAIVSRLIPGGMLYLATDIIEYAEMSHELLADTPALENMLDAPWVNDLPDRFHTKYEQKGFREGRPGHYFVYRRRENATIPIIPVIKELEMPHIILNCPLKPEELLDRFEQVRRSVGDVHVAVLHAYMGHNRTSVLFEVVVKEETIDQKVALILSERETTNEYIIRLGTIGTPRPTYGAHQAVDVLATWITSLGVGAEIKERKIQT